MSKILAVGMGPLLEEGVKKVGGQCLRTWHLVRPLILQGHPLKLVTLPIPDHYKEEADLPVMTTEHYRGFEYVNFNKNYLDYILQQIAKLCAEWQPDCIVSINQYPSYVVCRLPLNLPVWADLNGYVMAESQTRSYVYNDDRHLRHFWDQEFEVLRRADKFSTVSWPQLYALLGELAMIGRLNRYTFDYQFAVHIPNAVNELFLHFRGGREVKRLRGETVPQDAFIIIWSGGYNTWTDVGTLFTALEGAMKEEERIHFVSTGGMVEGHDEVTYKRFQEQVASSPYKARFHLLGWVEAERLPAYYIDSNVGINIDSYNYETIFGARNRLINMMAMGLPVITSLGTEISYVIEEQGIGYTFNIGDLAGLKGLLLKLSREPEEDLKSVGSKGREFVLTNFSYEETTKELQAWVEAPNRAPDNEKKFSLNESARLVDVHLNEIEKDIANISQEQIQSIYKAKELIRTAKHTPLYTLYKLFKRLKK